MTADVELPLPRYPVGGAGDEDSYNTGWNDCLDECRANVAHATAAKDAEIEALRAEVERLKTVAHAFVDDLTEKDRRVMQLSEALREAREDAERLDWMDANGFTAYRAIDPIDGLSDHAVVVHETQRPRRGNVADTIRQAIDQAREKGVAG